MASVRATLSLSSVGVLSSPLNISVNSLLVVDSGSLIRAKVKGTAADSNDLAIYIENQCSERAYLYVKNMESELENYIYVHKVDTMIEYGVFGNDDSSNPYGGS